MNIEDKIPEIGRECYFYYNYYDKNKNEKYDCIITDSIEFEKIDPLLLKLWKLSLELYKDKYATETDYFIYVKCCYTEDEDESYYIFVKGINENWIELYNPNQILVFKSELENF